MSDLGTDLSCVTDIDPTGAMVSGRTSLAQACARRLSTDRGTLLDDPNYGYNLTEFVNADVSPADVAALRSGVEAECLKDERVLACTADAVLGRDGVLTITITLTDADGPFELVLSVSDTTIALLTVDP